MHPGRPVTRWAQVSGSRAAGWSGGPAGAHPPPGAGGTLALSAGNSCRSESAAAGQDTVRMVQKSRARPVSLTYAYGMVK